MTYSQYLAKVHTERPSEQRPGQWAFNLLYKVRPDLAEEIRTSVLDPFHDDSRLPALQEFLAGAWHL